MARAEEWPWSSLVSWCSGEPVRLLHPGPVERSRDWLSIVQRPETDEELEALRRCVWRGTPFGSEAWVERTAKRLGLEFTLRPRGRPPKREK